MAPPMKWKAVIVKLPKHITTSMYKKHTNLYRLVIFGCPKSKLDFPFLGLPFQSLSSHIIVMRNSSTRFKENYRFIILFQTNKTVAKGFKF